MSFFSAGAIKSRTVSTDLAAKLIAYAPERTKLGRPRSVSGAAGLRLAGDIDGAVHRRRAGLAGA